ncbi:MAG: hydroxymethylglutaryl-CoA synthase family protein [Candidatus Geothermincolia bacterium]
MVGISSYGGYVPRYRLNRMVIYGSMGWINPVTITNAQGEKAVANFDEDAITMAVAAGADALAGFDRSEVDGVYLATTSAPYRERQNANLVAGALSARDDVRTADFTGSLKSGTTALLAGIEAVAAGNAGRMLVAGADCRLGKMGTAQEMIFGDAGAAFLLSDRDVIAEFKGAYSVSYDFVDHYRGASAQFDRQWEDRWIRDEGYARFIPEVVQGFCARYGMQPSDFAKVIYPCNYAGARRGIDKKMGLSPEQAQDALMGAIGDAGAAQPLVMLARALEEAQPGDKLLVIGYGNGCDALAFEVTESIKRLAPRRGVSGSLANRADLDNYAKYLVWRRMVPADIGMRGEEDQWTRWSLVWRNNKVLLGMQGNRCAECGTQSFPPQKICVNPDCGAVGRFEPVYVADKGGKVFSFTSDMLAASPNPPAIYGNVEINGGGRFFIDFTDCTLEDLQVGGPVDFSFRLKYYDPKRDISFYFWKAVPTREVT